MNRFHFVLPALLIASMARAAQTPTPVPVDITPPPTGIRTSIITPVAMGRPHACADLYPQAAVEAKAEGVTTLSFIVTAEGTTRDITVVASSGNADLDAAAVTCVGRWRYRPQTENGVPEEARWQGSVRWFSPAVR